jgi:hypothetical protein
LCEADSIFLTKLGERMKRPNSLCEIELEVGTGGLDGSSPETSRSRYRKPPAGLLSRQGRQALALAADPQNRNALDDRKDPWHRDARIGRMGR